MVNYKIKKARGETVEKTARKDLARGEAEERAGIPARATMEFPHNQRNMKGMPMDNDTALFPVATITAGPIPEIDAVIIRFDFLTHVMQRRAEIDARVLSAAFAFAAEEWRGHIDMAIADGDATAIWPPIAYLASALDTARLANSGKPITADALLQIQQASNNLAGELIKRGFAVGLQDSDIKRAGG